MDKLQNPNIEEFIDKLLVQFDDHNASNLYILLDKAGLPSAQQIMETNSNVLRQLHDALTKSFKYAEVEGTSGQWYSLTEKGHAAKAAGGHFAYVNKLTDKAKADEERQHLNDEKLKYDVKNSKRIFKTYWWTFVFALVSFIYVLVQIVLKVLEAVSPHIDK